MRMLAMALVLTAVCDSGPVAGVVGERVVMADGRLEFLVPDSWEVLDRVTARAGQEAMLFKRPAVGDLPGGAEVRVRQARVGETLARMSNVGSGCPFGDCVVLKDVVVDDHWRSVLARVSDLPVLVLQEIGLLDGFAISFVFFVPVFEGQQPDAVVIEEYRAVASSFTVRSGY